MDTPALVIRYVMYAAMAAIVAAGVLGLLERDRRAQAAGATAAIAVDWPDVTRQGLKPDLQVRFTNTGDRPATPRVALEAAYLNALQFGGVHPDPVEVVPVARGLLEYRFAALEPGGTLGTWFTFSIDHQADDFRTRGRLRAALGAEVLVDREISTIVLP